MRLALFLALVNSVAGGGLFGERYGSGGDESGIFVVPLADSGFFVLGYCESAPGYGRTYVLRVDKDGELMWSKYIVDSLGGIILHSATGDGVGGGVVVGQQRSSQGDWDMFVQWVDSSGSVVWKKTSGSAGVSEIATAVCPAENDGWVVIGNTVGSYDYDVAGAWFDRSGYRWWSKVWASSNNNFGYAVTNTFDRGYVIAGATYPSNTGFSDMLIFKVDYWGEMVWWRQYGESLWDEALAIVQTKDSGFALAGFSSSYGEDIDGLLLRTDSYGNKRWLKTFPKKGFEKLYGLAETEDGGFVLVGESAFPGGDENLVFIRTDESGNLLWQRFYGWGGYDCGKAVVELNDGFVVTGKSWKDSINRFDVYLLRSDHSGRVGLSEEVRENFQSKTFRVSPNPFKNEVRVAFGGGREIGNAKVRVYNWQGCLIRTLDGKDEVVWNGCDFSNLPVAKGVYIMILPDNQRVKLVRL